MLIHYTECISCKNKITYKANWGGAHLKFKVGSCSWCNKTLYFMELPFRACGLMGPDQAVADHDFYFFAEYLDDIYVKIEKDFSNHHTGWTTVD